MGSRPLRFLLDLAVIVGLLAVIVVVLAVGILMVQGMR